MKLSSTACGLLGLALASATLAACSPSSSSGAPSSASPSAPAASASGKAASLGLLWQVKGEGPYGQDDYQNGAQLAIDKVNAAGGVNGKPVTWFRESLDPLDNAKTLAPFLSAVDQKPTVMVGLVAPTQVQALSAKITSSGIPVVATVTSDPFDAFGAKSGSEFLWFLGALNPAMASFGTDFLINDLKLKDIAVMGTNESYGTIGMAAATQTLKDAGLKPYAIKPYSPAATDLTKEVLAMKGADGVFDWGYPNTVGVQLNQFVQNGIIIPTMSSGGTMTTVQFGLAKGEAIANLYASMPCDLSSPDYSKTASDFVKAFQAKYKYLPSQNASWAYDGVNVAVAAIEKAGSTDPSSVNAAMSQIDVPGVCSITYKADPAHFMGHSMVISKFSKSGTTTVVKQAVIPDQPAG